MTESTKVIYYMSWRKTEQFWPEVLEIRVFLYFPPLLKVWHVVIRQEESYHSLTLTSALLSALRSVLNEATTKKVLNNFSLVFNAPYTLLLTVASGSDLVSVCEVHNAKLHPEKAQFKPSSAPRGFTHLEKRGGERSVSWWIQLSARHKLNVQSGPFFNSELSIYPAVTASLSVHETQQRGEEATSNHRVSTEFCGLTSRNVVPQAGQNNQTGVLKCSGTYLAWTAIPVE